jgi:hypothetical protein
MHVHNNVYYLLINGMYLICRIDRERLNVGPRIQVEFSPLFFPVTCKYRYYYYWKLKIEAVVYILHPEYI